MATWTKEVVDLSVAGSSLTVDSIKIDGTNIGHTDDTDLLSLASGTLTVNGALSTTTLATSGDATVGGNLTITGNILTFGNGEIVSNVGDETMTLSSPVVEVNAITKTTTASLRVTSKVNYDSQLLFREVITSKWSIANDATNDNLTIDAGTSTVGGATKLSLDTSGNTTIAGGLTTNGASQLNSTLTVGVNDTGYDVQFYGDTAANYMLWDTSQDKLIINSSGNAGNLELVSTDTDAETGPGINLTRTAAGADNDSIGMLNFYGQDGGGNSTLYSRVYSQILEADDGNEQGSLHLGVMTESSSANALKTGLWIKGTNTNDTVDCFMPNGSLTIGGDLTVTGGDIDLSGEASTITLIDNTTSAFNIGSAGKADLFTINTNDNAETVDIDADRTNVINSAIGSLALKGTCTGITGNTTNSNLGGLHFEGPSFVNQSGTNTITQHSYIKVDTAGVHTAGSGTATITNVCLLDLEDNLGTTNSCTTNSDKTGNAKSGTIKVNVNGTIYHIQLYAN
tara:strand:- start:1793 stop:3328 length:1536 start_codon:yes stop_codon:yes gene_type:complete